MNAPLTPIESRLACLKALFVGEEVTATNSLHFLSTRTSNIICDLRGYHAIAIKTERVKAASGKHYGSYKLEQTAENIVKASFLIDELEKQTRAEAERKEREELIKSAREATRVLEDGENEQRKDDRGKFSDIDPIAPDDDDNPFDLPTGNRRND